MKKLLMVICVLSLLCLLVVPVLADAFAGPDADPAPKPGTIRSLVVEEPVRVAMIGLWSPAPLS